jgi:hypothetical protein
MKFSRKVIPLITLAVAIGTTSALAQQNQPKPSEPAVGAQSAMDMKNMHAQMDQMRAQMEQMQTLMKDTMAKMAAADAAMKSHMETEQASMKSQMELQQAVIGHLQTMTDHMQMMHPNMATTQGPMNMPKHSGAPIDK